jgi:hypothetical protein
MARNTTTARQRRRRQGYHRSSAATPAGLAATIEAIKAEGIVSANGIAAALNARDIETARGGRWTARSVLNVTARIAA